MSIVTKKNAIFMYGLIDIVRGILHTIFVKHASENIAGLVKKDMSVQRKNNIYTLMNGFGVSNFQTGIIKLLISRNEYKKKYNNIFLLQFLLFVFGFSNSYIQNINDVDAELPGRYFMSIYGMLSLFLYLAKI